jgi:hypothetical protein
VLILVFHLNLGSSELDDSLSSSGKLSYKFSPNSSSSFDYLTYFLLSLTRGSGDLSVITADSSMSESLPTLAGDCNR